MDFFPFSINVVFLPYTSILILTTTNVKPDPCTIFTTFHTENALKTRGRHENGMFNKEYLLRFVFRL